MKLVSESGKAELEMRLAQQRLELSLIHLATNLLRIAAGAERPVEFLRAMAECCEVAAAGGFAPFAEDISWVLEAGRRDCEREQKLSASERKWRMEHGHTGVCEAALAVRIESLRVLAGQRSGNLEAETNAKRKLREAMVAYRDACAAQGVRRQGR